MKKIIGYLLILSLLIQPLLVAPKASAQSTGIDYESNEGISAALTIEWLSQTYQVPEIRLIEELNRGYTLEHLHAALQVYSMDDSKFADHLHQLYPEARALLQQHDYTAARFEMSSSEGEPVIPSPSQGVLEAVYGKLKHEESNTETIIHDRELMFPSVLESTYGNNQGKMMAFSSSTFPTAYDEFAIKRKEMGAASAPFSLSASGENVSTITGSLQLQSADLVLPGRNGLSFSLKRQYSSADAGYYDKEIFSNGIYTYNYYPALTARLNYLYGNAPVGQLGSASDFHFIPYTYQSFVQYAGSYTNWYFPSSFPVIEDFDNEVRRSLEATWRYVNPDDPNSPVFMSREFNLAGTPLIARAYTTGYVMDNPFHTPQYRGMAYGNRTKPIADEKRFALGKGWSWDIPYIEFKPNKKAIHMFGGAVYEIGAQNELKGYPWKDLTLSVDSSVSVNNTTSYYVLKALDGTKQYFSSSGYLIQISDAYNNTIQFEYGYENTYGYVLKKVRDAFGNEIQLAYQGLQVTATLGDRTVLYEKVMDPQGNKELLAQVTDVMGRKTQYVYEVAVAPFDLVGGGRFKDNFVALLKQIHHPTGARTNYTYQSFSRNLGLYATERVYRVSSREDGMDLQGGGTVNRHRQDYTYYDDGGAEKKQTFSFSTTVNNGRTLTTYTYKKQYVDENSPSVLYHTSTVQEAIGSQPLQKKTIQQTYDETRKRTKPLSVAVTESVGTSNGATVTVQHTYDDYGNVLTETGPHPITTTYSYAPTTHLLVNVSQPLGAGQQMYVEMQRNAQGSIVQQSVREQHAGGTLKGQTSYQYDAYGNTQEITIKDDTRDIGIQLGYGTQHGFPISQSVQVTDAAGAVSTITQQMGYNPLTGEKTFHTNGKQLTTHYSYDKLGRMVRMTFPDGSFTTAQYDDVNNQATVTDPTGVVTISQWDAFGAPTASGIQGKGWSRNGYDAYGRVSWSEDRAGRRTTYQYDAWDRTISVLYPGTEAAAATVSYDPIGRTTISTDPEGNWSKETRDTLGQVVVQEAFAANGTLQNKEQYGYDAAGRLISKTDAKLATTLYSYDILDRLQAVTDPNGATTSYAYSLANQLTRIIHPDQAQVVKAYDELGRLIRQTDPMGQMTTYSYDANSNLIQITDRNGQVEINSFDNRDRLISSVKGPETISYGYDTAGRRLWMQDGTGLTSYSYEPGSAWLTRVTMPDNRTIDYAYDLSGNRTQMTDPFGVVTAYGYDSRNRLSGVGPSLNNWDASYTYKKNNFVASTNLRNGVISTQGYDGLNLTNITQTKSGGAVLNTFGYGYDLNRNQTNRTENGISHTFSYDNMERIATSTLNNEQYAYDNRGNRLSYQSDKPLDLTSASYQYDKRNRLTQVSLDHGANVGYRYNGDGLLVERTENGQTTRYYYDGANIVAEGTVGSGGAAVHKASYVRGSQLVARVDASGSKAYYLHNGHGDVVGLTDGAGNVLNQYSYDIWGSPITEQESVPNPFRYSGELWDDTTQLQYLRARWYDPGMGRFINEDTYEGDISNPLSLNLYTYVHNNPLVNIDPSGHWCTSADGKYSHAGGCNGGEEGVEIFADYNGSTYVDDETYAKNALIDLLFKEFSNSKMAYSAIMNDPLGAVINNKGSINSVGGAFEIPPEVLGAIIFREQATRKMSDNVLNVDTWIRGVEHSVGLGAIFPTTARSAWENFGVGDQIPSSNYDLQKKLTTDNTFNITTIALVLYNKADTNNINISSGDVNSWVSVLPYYNSSMSSPAAQQAGNNYSSRTAQYIPYIEILLK